MDNNLKSARERCSRALFLDKKRAVPIGAALFWGEEGEAYFSTVR